MADYLVSNESVFRAAAEQARKRAKSKHDGLCVTETQFSTCHCMAKCCWQEAARRSQRGMVIGICVCQWCPCDSAKRYDRMTHERAA